MRAAERIDTGRLTDFLLAYSNTYGKPNGTGLEANDEARCEHRLLHSNPCCTVP